MTNRKRTGLSTRRRYLAMVGSGAVAAGLAGCSESSDDGDSTPAGTPAGTGTPAGGDGTPTESGGASGQTAGLDPCLRPASASTCDSPVSVSGTLTEDATWGGDCDEYLVTDTVEVENGATLTVEPGTRVVFAQNTSLQIREDSALSAVGSCGSPIAFTGEQETRGYWEGIQLIEADQELSELSYCIVEYGGGDRFTWASAAGNVVVTDGARMSMTNSMVRESAGYGVVLDSNVTVDAFTQNVLTANADGAALAHARTADAFSDTGSYAGNDEDVVLVTDGTIQRDAEPTWDALDVPYRVASGDDVTVQGHLTVAPGATIEFGQDCALLMDDVGPGRLTAVGIDPDTEASMPITFTGEQQTRGYWQGMQFYESDRTENQLRNCVVEYGGGDRFTWAGVPANVVVIEGSRVRIDGSTIRESEGYGVEVDGGSTIDSFTTNTVTRNDDGAVHTHPSSAGSLSDTSTYSGNDEDRVTVYDGTIGADTELTWDGIDVPYYVVSGADVTVQGHLTIEPGTTVEFGQDAAMTMDDVGPGQLTAVGMNADESVDTITFTGEQRTRGYWQGLQFYQSNRTENRLHYCVVEYGGGDRFTWAQEPANVVVIEGSRLSLQHSTVRESAGYGVDVDGDSTLTESNNTITNNASGSIDY
ncbi:right-handed parallel beta-helix repeat-containing protein [Haloarcula onubensis]|uniref:Right-handed parallel beta-helix repeat-containing protein n=1 Tax=Haloarcula onubensis TaxID=2950539 RepID=A0ABU2FKU8_9EURY|nr:right-handed parallel beta-helix repeat-containing protein [Halomicroarcula sp. S3CR25-11]MDS0281380.1 right-handed parallel beta-helix repeat-containing protein [Halomicroarcula sp. S3CR25-11]